MTCSAAGREPELHRGDPDAARRPVHQQPLPGRELRLREEGVVRGCEHLDEAAGLLPAHPIRHGEDMRLVSDCKLRVTAAGEERHYVRPALGLTGALEPRHVGRAGRRRVAAGALAEIGIVHARGTNAEIKTSPTCGAGSGWSSISICPPTITAARKLIEALQHDDPAVLLADVREAVPFVEPDGGRVGFHAQ